MKSLKLISTIILLAAGTVFISGCHYKQTSTGTLSATDSEINKFIWSGMNYYYLWNDSVYDLVRFSNENNLDAFLNGYTDHTKLFDDLLYPTRDKWSWIVDDYTKLEQSFQGVTKSMGYNFGLVRYNSSSKNIFGYVRYVVNGSPAERAGIKRGDIFIKVNGQQLTTDNYQSLLSSDSYTLSFATISGNTISSDNVSASLSAVEIDEDPIFLDTIFTIQNTRIGYLIYNQFVSKYDLELNNVFQYFKSENIQKLILDFRYNPGGSVQSAIYLASMIYGTDTSQVFAKTVFNNNLEPYLQSKYGSNYFNDHFEDSVKSSSYGNGELIQSLGLKNLYIITSWSTASASELIINCLRPYMSVTTIGDTTVGKYVASTTIYDYDPKGIYDSYAGETVNPNHKWAMQPIILKTENALGQTDYYHGFAPALYENELYYLGNLSTLGNTNEPLLNATINYIFNNVQKRAIPSNGFVKFADSKDLVSHAKEMFVKPKPFMTQKSFR